MVAQMPPNEPDPTRRNERSRRAILDATIELIGELAYDNVSIEAIARHAGVGKQTIYRWWPSKGAVVLEALNDYLGPVVAYPDTGDIVADLRTQLTGIAHLVDTTGFGPAYRGLLAASQSDPALSRAHLDQMIEPNTAAFNERLERARERGEIRADADVEALRDLLYGYSYYRMLHAMPITPEHIDAALELTFEGLRTHHERP
jgi:AcrR family transcriptional regulator